MRRKGIITIVLGLVLFVSSGCADSSKENTGNEKNTIAENQSHEAVTSNVEEESTDSYSLMMSYVEQIKEDFEREQVVAIMGEPDMLEGSGIERNYYNFDEYKVCIIYAPDKLLLDIINNTTGERTNVY